MSFTYRDEDDTNPVHYRSGEEETVDKIRRSMGERFSMIADDIMHILSVHDRDEALRRINTLVARIAFQGFCFGNNIKYSDRKGLKGPVEVDELKANWYDQMDAHVEGLDYPDPREKALYRFEWENSLSIEKS